MLHSLIFGDEGEDFGQFPSDLDKKTPEELEAMGFEMIDSIDIRTDGSGELEIEEDDENKLDRIQKLIDSLDKKRAKVAGDK
jgi:hypothetical protein